MNFHIIAYTPHGSFSGSNSESSTWLDRSVFVMLAQVETVLHACRGERQRRDNKTGHRRLGGVGWQ